jgi:hypothetical protein
MLVLRQRIQKRLDLQFNSSNKDYVTFREIDDAPTALFDVAVPQFVIHPVPNPAWDDPSASHVFHHPLHALTPSVPYLEDLTHGLDALRQIIEAVANTDDDPDEVYLEPAVVPFLTAGSLCFGINATWRPRTMTNSPTSNGGL